MVDLITNVGIYIVLNLQKTTLSQNIYVKFSRNIY